MLSADEAIKRLAELQRELAPNHPLAGLKMTVCARRNDRDDILVSIADFDKPLATAHLTWHKETYPQWPTTRFFASWDEWLSEDMLPAHHEWTADS